MKKLALSALACLALLACQSSPKTASCADSERNPAGLKEMFQQKVMVHANCDYLTDQAAPGLAAAFAKNKDVVVSGCVNDPLAARLFADDDSKASVAERTQAYCGFNPVIRFCIVCNRVHDSPPLEEAFNRCKARLSPGDGESEDLFRVRVLKLPPLTPAADGEASEGASN